jgi:hypothetical protein
MRHHTKVENMLPQRYLIHRNVIFLNRRCMFGFNGLIIIGVVFFFLSPSSRFTPDI